LSDCQIQVESEGSHYNIVAIGDLFDGKRAVQRQQIIYAALKEQISSGAIHAVNMKIFTLHEWEQQA
jgi:acid stress-induced BolA-like protein IbaG/YrbA